MNKILLIDGNLLAFKSFFATAYIGSSLQTSTGIPTNAVHTFINTIFKLLKELNPTHIFVAFDKPGKTFRHEFFEEYKSKRQSTPDSLKVQFIYIKRVLSKMRICWFEESLIEADDLIATWVSKINTSKDEVIVYSSDKDLLQLVAKNVSVISKWDKNEYVIDNENNFFERHSIFPNQIPDFKALAGDASDNYLGISGIGPKTAINLLSEFQIIENLYENLANIKSKKVKEVLELEKDKAFLYKKIAKLKTDVNLNFSLEDIKLSYKFQKEAMEIFEELEMKNTSSKYLNVFNL
ncbi:5'-3' exonuclease [[Mycoplasma] mobile]|nr:5'-3' exonuclease [[Mycoplasma] mobile]